MGHAALKLKKETVLTVLEGGKAKAAVSAALQAPSREMLMLSAILIVLQISDGVLTAMGMHAFGIDAEGNALLRSLMAHMGYLPALIVAKSFAIGVIGLLCYLSTVVAWLPHAMRGVIAIYLLAAIIPWTYILFFNLL